MLTQTHVSNPGLGSRMAQPNESSLPIQSSSLGGTAWRKTWHTNSDVALRRTVVENILQLFQKRRGPVTQDWDQKLPDFMKRVEEALYRGAATKEGYADLQTLEGRLQTMAKYVLSANQRPQHGSQTLWSLLGNMSISGFGSGTMPTPGSASTMVPTPGTVNNMIPTPGGTSSMVPTPGHGHSLLPGVRRVEEEGGES